MQTHVPDVSYALWRKEDTRLGLGLGLWLSSFPLSELDTKDADLSQADHCPVRPAQRLEAPEDWTVGTCCCGAWPPQALGLGVGTTPRLLAPKQPAGARSGL